MIISKDIKFDCAHMLSRYEGLCSNLHGHTYHGSVTIEAETGANGMVLDYNTIKQIISKFDHAVIFSSEEFRDEAENELLAWVVKHSMRRFVIPYGRSTAETLASVIAAEFARYGNVTVALSETDGSYAEAKVCK